MSTSALFSRFKNPLGSALQDSTSYQRLAMAYRGLRERDQWALKVLGVFLVIVFAHTAIISPAKHYAYKWREAAGRNDHTLQWMRSNRASVETSVGNNVGGLDGESLLAIASSSAKNNGLSFKRFEPVDERSVRVWLENVDFNAAVSWIEVLHAQSGIAVRELQLDRVSELVNMNMVLQLQ